MRNVHKFDFPFDKEALRSECLTISGWDKYTDPRQGNNYSDNPSSVDLIDITQGIEHSDNPFEVVHAQKRDGWVNNSLEVAHREKRKFLNYYGLQKSHYTCVYHRLLADRILIPHKDYLVHCAVNLLLDDGPSSQVQFIDSQGIEKTTYECAVLNVSEMHSVKNGPTNRHLFKIAFYDVTHNDLVDIINSKRK